MCGAGVVISLMLGLRLVFALQPEPQHQNRDDNDTSDADANSDADADAGIVYAASALSDASVLDAEELLEKTPIGAAPLPAGGGGAAGGDGSGGGCGGVCGHVMCAAVVAPGGAPAALARYFSSSRYLERCRAEEGVRLIVRGARFPGAALAAGWLDARVRISDLQLVECALRELRPGAFRAPSFAYTLGLALEGNALRHLRPNVFEGLTSLKILVIRRNPELTTISSGALQPVSSSLRALTVQTSLYHPRLVTNLTGTVPLPHVEHVNLDYNALGVLESNAFKGLSGVQSISIRRSELKSLGEDILKPVASSLQVLRLDNNKLHTLSTNFFDSIHNRIHLGLTDNPWDCSCSVAWFQNLLLTSPKIQVAVQTLHCATPPHNENIPILEADFCEGNDTDPKSEEDSKPDDEAPYFATRTREIISRNTSFYRVDSPSVSRTRNEVKEIQIHCDDPLVVNRSIIVHKDAPASIQLAYSNASLLVPLQEIPFTITGIGDTTVEISLPKTKEEEILYWYPRNLTESGETFSSSGCHVVKEDLLKVEHLQPGKVYVFCLVNATNPQRESGLSCVSVQTRELTMIGATISVTQVSPTTRRWFAITIILLVLVLAALLLYSAYGFLYRRMGSLEAAMRPRSSFSSPRPSHETQRNTHDIYWIESR